MNNLHVSNSLILITVQYAIYEHITNYSLTANGCLDYLQFATIINTPAKSTVVHVCEFLQVLETSVYTYEWDGWVLGYAYLQLE